MTMWSVFRSDGDPMGGFGCEQDAMHAMLGLGVCVERLGCNSFALQDMPNHWVTAKIREM